MLRQRVQYGYTGSTTLSSPPSTTPTTLQGVSASTTVVDNTAFRLSESGSWDTMVKVCSSTTIFPGSHFWCESECPAYSWGLWVEPCAGPNKTIVKGFPRVVVECLLALAKHTRGWTATLKL